MHDISNYFKKIEQVTREKEITKLDMWNIDKTGFYISYEKAQLVFFLIFIYLFIFNVYMQPYGYDRHASSPSQKINAQSKRLLIFFITINLNKLFYMIDLNNHNYINLVKCIYFAILSMLLVFFKLIFYISIII